jgi:hypothetical protein
VPWTTLAEEQKRELGKDVSQVLALDTMYWRVGQVVERVTPPLANTEAAKQTVEISGVRSIREGAAALPDSPDPL